MALRAWSRGKGSGPCTARRTLSGGPDMGEHVDAAEILDREHVDSDRSERLLDFTLVGEHALVTVVDRCTNASGTEARAPLDLGIEVLQSGFHIVSIPRLVAAANDLDVLLRHRLLRQSGGFEGVLRPSEVPEPKHLALLELEHPSVRLIDSDTAFFPAKSELPEDQIHAVAGFAPLVPGELPTPRNCSSISCRSSDAVPPVPRTARSAGG